MKKVKLVCPTNDPIWVDEEHAKAILNHPTNKHENGWRLAEDEQKTTENAATADNPGNQGTAEEQEKSGPARKGGKA